MESNKTPHTGFSTTWTSSNRSPMTKTQTAQNKKHVGTILVSLNFSASISNLNDIA